MNRIEELHVKASQDSKQWKSIYSDPMKDTDQIEIKFDTGRIMDYNYPDWPHATVDGWRYKSDVKAQAQVTQDIATGFADFISKWGFFEAHGYWVSENSHYSGCAYTTTELYKIYLDTL